MPLNKETKKMCEYQVDIQHHYSPQIIYPQSLYNRELYKILDLHTYVLTSFR